MTSFLVAAGSTRFKEISMYLHSLAAKRIRAALHHSGRAAAHRQQPLDTVAKAFAAAPTPTPNGASRRTEMRRPPLSSRDDSRASVSNCSTEMEGIGRALLAGYAAPSAACVQLFCVPECRMRTVISQSVVLPGSGRKSLRDVYRSRKACGDHWCAGRDQRRAGFAIPNRKAQGCAHAK